MEVVQNLSLQEKTELAQALGLQQVQALRLQQVLIKPKEDISSALVAWEGGLLYWSISNLPTHPDHLIL